MWSTLKGKNLLPEEQILSFESRPLLKCEAQIVEMLPQQKTLVITTVFSTKDFAVKSNLLYRNLILACVMHE